MSSQGPAQSNKRKRSSLYCNEKFEPEFNGVQDFDATEGLKPSLWEKIAADYIQYRISKKKNQSKTDGDFIARWLNKNQTQESPFSKAHRKAGSLGMLRNLNKEEVRDLYPIDRLERMVKAVESYQTQTPANLDEPRKKMRLK